MPGRRVSVAPLARDLTKTVSRSPRLPAALSVSVPRHNRGMLIVSGHLVLDPADRDAHVIASVGAVRLARQAPGCLDFAVSADPVDPTGSMSSSGGLAPRTSMRSARAATPMTSQSISPASAALKSSSTASNAASSTVWSQVAPSSEARTRGTSAFSLTLSRRGRAPRRHRTRSCAVIRSISCRL